MRGGVGVRGGGGGVVRRGRVVVTGGGVAARGGVSAAAAVTRGAVSGGGRGRGGALGGGGGVLVGALDVLGAAEVVERLAVELGGEAELGLVGRVVVLLDVPEGVELAEVVAADLLPELLCVLGRGLGLELIRAGDGPAGLGDPDGLVAGGLEGGVHGGLEEREGVLDVVAALDLDVVAVLVVGVEIDTEEVELGDEGGDGAVVPDVPGVNVANGGRLEVGVLELLARLLDELGQDIDVGTDAGLVGDTVDRHTVQVLASDGDTDNKVGELLAVLLDGLGEGGELAVDALGAGCPHAEEDLGLGLDGGLEGVNGLGGLLGAGLDVGVQADGVEGARGVLELLLGLELGLEVAQGLGLAIVGGGARVEAQVLVLGGNGSGGGRESGDGGETHYEGIDSL